jgi:hypothetical protein
MGASFYWQPLAGKHLPVGARSRFMDMMTDAFGGYPWNLSAGDAEKLRAMRLGAEDVEIKAALETLAEACEKLEQITAWAQF